MAVTSKSPVNASNVTAVAADYLMNLHVQCNVHLVHECFRQVTLSKSVPSYHSRNSPETLLLRSIKLEVKLS